MRKVTARWTTKDGTKIRICDMSDGHLNSTIELLERHRDSVSKNYERDLMAASLFLQGEMALMDIDRAIDDFEENGVPDVAVHPLYSALCDEMERRQALGIWRFDQKLPEGYVWK